MKKLLVVFMAATVVAMFSFSLYAQEEKGMMEEGMMEKNTMMGKGMMHEGMKHEKMMGKGMMMRCMMGKEIVATQDGGVVILMGKKLMKYDKNLNLVKEVELKIDKKDWKTMMGDCPMWGRKGGMMEKTGEDKDKESSE